MKRRGAAAVVLVVLPAPMSALAQPVVGERDPAVEVRAVFAEKCAGCHGPDLPKPQGRFGYVLDLRRVAGNPEMVVPGRPDQSELWALVSHGDMPPADSPRGPLTGAEKEAVRAWIAAGAPDVGTTPAEASSASPDPESPAAVVPPSPTERTVRYLGMFHLILLHFPIALLFAAVIGELLALWRGIRGPTSSVRFCLLLAAVFVVPTVPLGWLLATGGNGAGAPQLLAFHRWAGTAAGLSVLAAAACARRDARREERSWRGRIALVVATLLVAATAHSGGLLTHGQDFFDR